MILVHDADVSFRAPLADQTGGADVPCEVRQLARRPPETVTIWAGLNKEVKMLEL